MGTDGELHGPNAQSGLFNLVLAYCWALQRSGQVGTVGFLQSTRQDRKKWPWPTVGRVCKAMKAAASIHSYFGFCQQVITKRKATLKHDRKHNYLLICLTLP